MLNPKKPSVITAKAQHYNMDYSPYEGFALEGSIEQVYLRGQLAVQDGQILLEKGGNYLKRGLPAYERKEQA